MFFIGLVLIYEVSLYDAIGTSVPKLHIYPNQSHITAPVNVSLGLVCEGKPEDGVFLGIRWAKNEYGEITDNVRETVSILKLTLSSPSIEDSGEYKCIALYENFLNDLEVQVVTIKVDFYEPIISEECPEIQKIIAGKVGRIKCRVIGNPMPETIWEKDGRPINLERIIMNEFDLMIPSVSEEDGGIYTLDAFVKETGNNLVKKINVTVLEADMCDYRCNGTLYMTRIDLSSQKECKQSLEEMECKIHHKELCLGSDVLSGVQLEYKLLDAYREICNETTLVHAGSHIEVKHSI